MSQIVLIRPGANDFVEQGRIQGNLDLPLNERGQIEVAQQIEQLRPLRLEALYTSDSEPALGTAKAIGEELDLRVKKLDRLENLDLGLWQGMSLDEVRHKHPKIYRQWQEQPESVCPPAGETLAAARGRVQAVLAKLLKKHKRGVIGLVLPEPLHSIARCALMHTAMGDPWKAGCTSGCFEVIEVSPVEAS